MIRLTMRLAMMGLVSTMLCEAPAFGASVSISGTVKDADGKPVAGVAIGIRTNSGATAVTGADGSFKLSGEYTPYKSPRPDFPSVVMEKIMASSVLLTGTKAGLMQARSLVKDNASGVQITMYPMPSGKVTLVGNLLASAHVLGMTKAADQEKHTFMIAFDGTPGIRAAFDQILKDFWPDGSSLDGDSALELENQLVERLQFNLDGPQEAAMWKEVKQHAYVSAVTLTGEIHEKPGTPWPQPWISTESFGPTTATVATFQLGYTNVVTLDGLTIQNGKGALYGGGIAVSGNQGGLFGSFNATITNCVIRNNIMANINGAGGGIALGVAGNTGNSPGSGTVTVVDSMILSNSSPATRSAAGIYLSCSNFTIRNCTVAYNTIGAVGNNNVTYSGGGIVAFGCYTGSIIQCTIASNGAQTVGNTNGPTAVLYGGGIRWDLTAANMPKFGQPGGGGVIRNCTIVGNMATNGGGVAITGALPGTGTNLLIESCIIANNITPANNTGIVQTACDVYYNGTAGVLQEQYNLIGNGATNGGVAGWLAFTNASGAMANNTTNIHSSYVGSNSSYKVDLNLGPLQINNNGKTYTMALLATGNTPAINHGTNTANLAYDQRGAAPYERTYGAGTDIGAYEYGAGSTNLLYNSYGWQDNAPGSGVLFINATNTSLNTGYMMTVLITNGAPVLFQGTDGTEWSNDGNNKLSYNSVTALTNANIPAGLTLHAAPTNGGMGLTIWMTGTISGPHGLAQSVNNIQFSFQDGAFNFNGDANGHAVQVANATVTNIAVTLRDAVSQAFSMSYAGTNFYENSTWNDGSIATTNQILILGNDQWADSVPGHDLIAGHYVTVSNVPGGLTAQLLVVNNTTANFILTGQATSHAAASSIGNLLLVISNTAMGSTFAPTNYISTNAVTFYDPATQVTLNWSGASFSESAANNGTMAGSLTVTLVSNLFVSGVASYVSFPGLPANLVGQVTYNNATNITIALTGAAVSHNAINNGTFQVQFTTNAFYNVDPSVSVANSNQTVSLSFLNPTIAWVTNATGFTELMPDNNGAIDPITYVIGTLTGDTFTASAGSSFTPANVPGGLTINVATTSPTTVKITLSGNAAAHAAAQSTNNLGLTFQNAAFTQGGAANVANYNPTNWAVTFYDPTKTWYVAATNATPVVGSDTNSGTSSSSPFATILNAIAKATAYDIIHILPGVITEQNGPGVGGLGALCGIQVTKSLQFVGEDTMITHGISIVQAAALPGVATNRLFYLSGSPYMSFRNLTLRNGCDDSAGNRSDSGGGAIMSKYQYTLIISNCYIYNCQSTNYAGGISFYPVSTQQAKNSNLYIYDSIIASNMVTGSAGYAGGLHTVAANGPSVCVYLYNSSIIGNVVTGYVGGAYIAASTALVQNCTFAGNSSQGTTANTGGALFLINHLTQVAGNQGQTNWTVRNCTIADNSAPAGLVGGLGYSHGVLSQALFLVSTIVAQNTATGGGAPDIKQLNPNFTYPQCVESYNLIGDCTNSALAIASSNVFIAAGQTLNANNSYIGNSGAAVGTVNPQLSTLANNGGPTPTMALQGGSLAIDHGANPGNLLSDQRGSGYNRVVGSQTDIGAYEFGAGPPTGLIIYIQ